MSQTTNILLCTCESYHAVPAEAVAAVRSALADLPAEVIEVSDLCGHAARRDERLARLAATPRSAVIACYRRAVRWLFAAACAPLDEGRTQLLNMRDQSPEEILRLLESRGHPVEGQGEPIEPTTATGAAAQTPADWEPWFPVIDYARCINCGQCMSFCLFGVYEVGPAERVVVARPNNCKTNCPACARVCPQAAIIFPKHPEAPINGAEPMPDDKGTQVNVADALGSDVYAALRSRSGGKRFAPKDARALAEAERSRCATLRAIRDKLGIAPEVLESICGPDCECHDEPVIDCGPDCECHDEPPADPAPDCGCQDPPAGTGQSDPECGCGCDGLDQE